MIWTDTLTIVATPITAMIGKWNSKKRWMRSSDDAGCSKHGLYYGWSDLESRTCELTFETYFGIFVRFK